MLSTLQRCHVLPISSVPSQTLQPSPKLRHGAASPADLLGEQLQKGVHFRFLRQELHLFHQRCQTPQLSTRSPPSTNGLSRAYDWPSPTRKSTKAELSTLHISSQADAPSPRSARPRANQQARPGSLFSLLSARAIHPSGSTRPPSHKPPQRAIGESGTRSSSSGRHGNPSREPSAARLSSQRRTTPRQPLSNTDVPFSRRMSKPELYNLYESSKTEAQGPVNSRHGQSTSAARHSLPHSSRRSRPSASIGRTLGPKTLLSLPSTSSSPRHPSSMCSTTFRLQPAAQARRADNLQEPQNNKSSVT
ncbi:hypothetical protein E1301_Tti020709 [Triplophysa tibetana]|uniref:Uncharacterized protein n=1 Tax=Triplophysa tibetana TaxID=1572043 RepID=A0A5A9PKF0_9TELE|nr:hypothetical protein E1301_Tti020709 [Triplophysa tibetana]